MPRSFLQFVEALTHLHGEATPCCTWRPAADIYRTPDRWLVKLDLAGVNPEEIQLALEGRRLTIAGSRRDALVQEGLTSYSLEINYNQFERTIELPFEPQETDVRTEYRDGMLMVWLREKGA